MSEPNNLAVSSNTEWVEYCKKYSIGDILSDGKAVWEIVHLPNHSHEYVILAALNDAAKLFANYEATRFIQPTHQRAVQSFILSKYINNDNSNPINNVKLFKPLGNREILSKYTTLEKSWVNVCSRFKVGDIIENNDCQWEVIYLPQNSTENILLKAHNKKAFSQAYSLSLKLLGYETADNYYNSLSPEDKKSLLLGNDKLFKFISSTSEIPKFKIVSKNNNQKSKDFIKTIPSTQMTEVIPAGTRIDYQGYKGTVVCHLTGESPIIHFDGAAPPGILMFSAGKLNSQYKPYLDKFFSDGKKNEVVCNIPATSLKLEPTSSSSNLPHWFSSNSKFVETFKLGKLVFGTYDGIKGLWEVVHLPDSEDKTKQGVILSLHSFMKVDSPGDLEKLKRFSSFQELSNIKSIVEFAGYKGISPSLLYLTHVLDDFELDKFLKSSSQENSSSNQKKSNNGLNQNSTSAVDRLKLGSIIRAKYFGITGRWEVIKNPGSNTGVILALIRADEPADISKLEYATAFILPENKNSVQAFCNKYGHNYNNTRLFTGNLSFEGLAKMIQTSDDLPSGTRIEWYGHKGTVVCAVDTQRVYINFDNQPMECNGTSYYTGHDLAIRDKINSYSSKLDLTANKLFSTINIDDLNVLSPATEFNHKTVKNIQNNELDKINEYFKLGNIWFGTWRGISGYWEVIKVPGVTDSVILALIGDPTLKVGNQTLWSESQFKIYENIDYTKKYCNVHNFSKDKPLFTSVLSSEDLKQIAKTIKPVSSAELAKHMKTMKNTASSNASQSLDQVLLPGTRVEYNGIQGTVVAHLPGYNPVIHYHIGNRSHNILLWTQYTYNQELRHILSKYVLDNKLPPNTPLFNSSVSASNLSIIHNPQQQPQNQQVSNMSPTKEKATRKNIPEFVQSRIERFEQKNNEELDVEHFADDPPPTEREVQPSSVKKTLTKVGKRIAVKQITQVIRTGVVNGMTERGAKPEEISLVSKMLQSEYGLALIAMLLGVGLPFIPKYGENEDVKDIAKEFRIQSLTTVGNEVLTQFWDGVKDLIVKSVQSIPTEVTEQAMLEQFEDLDEQSEEDFDIDNSSEEDLLEALEVDITEQLSHEV